MPTHEGIEPEMENFLRRVVPGIAEQWRGSTLDEIAQLEELANHSLPPFYRWFLTRMGQSMGPLAYPRLDFSAQRVLTCYAENLVAPHPRLLLIGHDSDEMIPLHIFYDLGLPTRADARITKRDADGGERHDQFETFREMLASGAMLRFEIDRMPQRCRSLLWCDDSDILSHLDQVMDSLGFTKPVPTGISCGLYERRDAAMVCSRIPPDAPEPVMVFRLGGSDSSTLRKIMGAIAAEPALRIEVREWNPPLA